jgi:hypothetical protein
MMFALFVISMIVVWQTEATSVFDGDWRLDRSRDSGSMVDLLELVGVGYVKRRIIATMNIDERYELTRENFRVARFTTYGDTDNTYRLGVTQDIQDPILGAVKSLVHVSDDQHRIQSTLTRISDQAIFVSTRRVTREDPQQLIYTVNFTRTDGNKAYVVRHYNKLRQ